MGFTDRKLETAILALSIVMIGGMGYVLKAPVQSALVGGDITYEMPRPKKSFFASLFDLGDREVDRTYKNPFAKKQAEEKKKAEAAKAAQATAAKQAQKTAAAKKVEDKKKPTVSINTVSATPAKKWGDDGFFAAGGGLTAGQGFEGNTNNADKTAEDNNKMTGDQWQALLRAQPTAENVAKLIAAYNSKDVDDDTFYKIVADLYSANKAETQALGLMAVKAVYGSKSFMVTAQYYEQFTSDLQSKARSYLLSYAVAGRLGMLASILTSSDSESTYWALQVVKEGYLNAKSGAQQASDPRNSRGDVVTNSIAGYAQFVPILQQLSMNAHDASIKELASSTLSQLQSTVASL